MSLLKDGRELELSKRNGIEAQLVSYYSEIRAFGFGLLSAALLILGTCGEHILYGSWASTFDKSPYVHLFYAFGVIISVSVLTAIGAFEVFQRNRAVRAIRTGAFKYTVGKVVDVLTVVDGNYTIDNEKCVILPEHFNNNVEDETVVVAFRVNGTTFATNIDKLGDKRCTN